MSVSLTVDDDKNLGVVLDDLRRLGEVGVERERGIIAVVGAGLAEDSGAIARAIHAIGDVHLHMLSLDSSGINLTIVIDAAAMKPVMQRLHDAFFAEAA